MGSSGIPILGSVMQMDADNQDTAAKTQSAQYNANVKYQQADQAIQQSAEQERQHRVYASQVMGNIKSGYASSGVSGGSGSALDVLASSARNAEMDSLNIKHAGAMKAWAYKAGANLDIMNRDNANAAGDIRHTKDVANGAWSVISMGAGAGSGGGD